MNPTEQLLHRFIGSSYIELFILYLYLISTFSQHKEISKIVIDSLQMTSLLLLLKKTVLFSFSDFRFKSLSVSMETTATDVSPQIPELRHKMLHLENDAKQHQKELQWTSYHYFYYSLAAASQSLGSAAPSAARRTNCSTQYVSNAHSQQIKKRK